MSTPPQLFSKAHRDEIKSGHPTATPPEVTKLLSEAWKGATKAERDMLEAQAQVADRKRGVFYCVGE